MSKLEQSVLEELEEYADLEGCELGEAIEYMLSLHNMFDYVTDEFTDAIVEELQYWHEWFKENTVIVIREESQYEYRELVFLDE